MSDQSHHPPSSAPPGSSGPLGPWADMIDEYLDGVLSPGDTAALEREMRSSAALRAAVDASRAAQGQIDAALARRFGPAAMANVARPIEVAEQAAAVASNGTHELIVRMPRTAFRPGKKQSQLPLAAIAAVMLLAAGAMIYLQVSGEGFGDDLPRHSLVEPIVAYRTAAAGGFKPTEVCVTPEAFAEWTKGKYGATLRPKAGADAGVQFVGWSYARVVTDYSALLYAKVQGKDVIVIIDRVDDERKPASACGIGASGNRELNMFRTVVGPFVLYEVTPLGTPVVSLTLESPG